MRPPTRQLLIRVGSLVLLIVATSLIGDRLGWFDYRHAVLHLDQLRRSYNVFVLAGIFALVCGAATAFGMPGLPFMIGGGALFGTLLGALVCWTGTMLGALIGYWIARTVGHDTVAWWLERLPKFHTAISDAADFAGILRLRLLPVIPLALVTYAAGLARAPFARYMVATAIGSLPSIIIYAYFADRLMRGAGGRGAWVTAFVTSLLLVVLSLTPKLIGRKH